MSIRLRLTLLYSGILTLTLLLFGVTLYSIQAQDTLNSLKGDLINTSKGLNKDINILPRPVQPEYEQDLPPKTFDEFSDEQTFQGLREREIVRILDSEGNLIVSPFGRATDALPLAEEGLLALQNLENWWEEAYVDDTHMLIYSHPITDETGTLQGIVQVARSLNERDRTLSSLAVTLVTVGGVMILVAFGAGWALSGMSLRPIDRITRTAKTIGDKRDFTRRVDYSGPTDEVGRLANTFNLMLSRLQEAYQRVENSLTKQREFVADVSHELRTPLTTLRGNLGLLYRNPMMAVEEKDDILSDMVEESDRLIRLVNDLLVLARAEAGRNFVKKPVRVLPVIEETVRQVKLLDPERNIQMEVPGGLKVMGDHDALKQIMLILLDNAIKHSQSDIDVKADYSDGKVHIVVQDYGEGFDPELLPHVFDRFQRGENNENLPGFGLGLPIAKALTEGLGGRIFIKNNSDQGCQIILEFHQMG